MYSLASYILFLGPYDRTISVVIENFILISQFYSNRTTYFVGLIDHHSSLIFTSKSRNSSRWVPIFTIKNACNPLYQRKIMNFKVAENWIFHLTKPSVSFFLILEAKSRSLYQAFLSTPTSSYKFGIKKFPYLIICIWRTKSKSV